MCTVSRRPLTAKDGESQHGMRNVTVDRVADVLPETDALVCLLPLTDATRGFVAAPLLERLKRGAVFINGGRGEHVVEDDLLAALDSGAPPPLRRRVASTHLPCDVTFWGTSDQAPAFNPCICTMYGVPTPMHGSVHLPHAWPVRAASDTEWREW